MKHLVENLAHELLTQSKMLVTAESCTGGLVAKLCTDLAGSSGWFERGFVTYSNKAKIQMLKVDENLIDRHGAVSREVVAAMARGALNNSAADFALAVSGIAGPGGGSAAKPVGTVWFGFADNDANLICSDVLFAGDRDVIRQQSTEYALQGILNLVKTQTAKL